MIVFKFYESTFKFIDKMLRKTFLTFIFKIIEKEDERDKIITKLKTNENDKMIKKKRIVDEIQNEQKIAIVESKKNKLNVKKFNKNDIMSITSTLKRKFKTLKLNNFVLREKKRQAWKRKKLKKQEKMWKKKCNQIIKKNDKNDEKVVIEYDSTANTNIIKWQKEILQFFERLWLMKISESSNLIKSYWKFQTICAALSVVEMTSIFENDENEKMTNVNQTENEENVKFQNNHDNENNKNSNKLTISIIWT